jgi:hypothetical protein
MKTILLFLCVLLISKYASAQDFNCPTTANLEEMQVLDSERYQRFMALEAFTANYINSQLNGSNRLIDPSGVIIIPVVVHVLYDAAGPLDISYNEIVEQIKVLNEDFRRTNPDRVNTPPVFAAVAADIKYEFRLACTDPMGGPTDGVVRKKVNKKGFDYKTNQGNPDDYAMGIKLSSGGGDDAWPTDRYLNIWTCKLNGNLGGYATWPGDYTAAPQFDGVVVHYSYFGRKSLGIKGRVCTHEVGHWLNLRHIWGDAPCGNDFVDDTPTQLAVNYNCPAFPHFSNCAGNTPTGDMFMNYMDASGTFCMNTFTRLQGLRTRAIFAPGGPRFSFIENYFRIEKSTNTFFCNGVVKLTNPNCLPVVWSIVSGPATVVPHPNYNNQAIVQATGIGAVTVRATAGNYESDAVINVDNTPIATGFYNYTSNCCVGTSGLGPNNNHLVPPGQSMCFTINLTTVGLGNFVWANSGYPVSYGANGAALTFCLPAPTTGYATNTTIFSLSATSPCGNIVNQQFRFNVTAAGWMSFKITASPNPAKGNIMVSTSNESEAVKQLGSNENIIINLYEFNRSALVKQWRFKNDQPQYNLNSSGLPKGQYILEVQKGAFKESKQIVIEE